jgi:hypothetical protein
MVEFRSDTLLDELICIIFPGRAFVRSMPFTSTYVDPTILIHSIVGVSVGHDQ